MAQLRLLELAGALLLLLRRSLGLQAQPAVQRVAQKVVVQQQQRQWVESRLLRVHLTVQLLALHRRPLVVRVLLFPGLRFRCCTRCC